MGPLVGFLPTDEHGLKRARRPLVGGGQALRCDRFLDILLHSELRGAVLGHTLALKTLSTRHRSVPEREGPANGARGRRVCTRRAAAPSGVLGSARPRARGAGFPKLSL